MCGHESLPDPGDAEGLGRPALLKGRSTGAVSSLGSGTASVTTLRQAPPPLFTQIKTGQGLQVLCDRLCWVGPPGTAPWVGHRVWDSRPVRNWANTLALASGGCNLLLVGGW
jgi:hypothetical protein